jgi:phage protein U
MLCSLGDFVFEVGGVEFEKLNRNLKFNFAKRERIGTNPTYQNIKGYEESFSLEGKLIAKSNSSLKQLEDIAKRKLPVRLTLGSGESLKVIIDSIGEARSMFLKDGHYVKNDFKVSLKAIYD